MRIKCKICQTEILVSFGKDEVDIPFILVRCKCGEKKREFCPQHPKYQVINKPRSNCHVCWHIYYRKHNYIL
jgi:hypothetical protein